MKVKLLNCTSDAEELLILTKNIRHGVNEESRNRIYSMTREQKDAELEYVMNTIESSLEFVDATFLIEEVSRAFTHQIVRHRFFSFAQTSLRFSSSNYKYYTPKKIGKTYHDSIKNSFRAYDKMIAEGEEIQDSRNLLPIASCSDIIIKGNLRAYCQMISERLCLRVQDEFREVAFKLQELLLEKFPFLKQKLSVVCAKTGKCPWKNFKKCPIKLKYKYLEEDVKDFEDICSMNKKCSSLPVL